MQMARSGPPPGLIRGADGPVVIWVGADPPRPRLLMHQLSALHGSTEFPHLDSHVFAQETRNLLAQLPAPVGPPAIANQEHQ
jgi:hypothetical protein